MKVNNQTLSNEWPTYCHTGIYIGTTSVKLAENAYLKIIFLLFALHKSGTKKSFISSMIEITLSKSYDCRMKNIFILDCKKS